MARPATHTLPLSDGRQIPASMQLRGQTYRVKFLHPDGKYKVTSTGRSDITQAWQQAGKIVLAAYSPTITPNVDTKKLTWDQILERLPDIAPGLREKSRTAFVSKITVFRELVPTSNGPHDVTEETAEQFIERMYKTPFKKSDKPGAKLYPRTLTTVRTARRVLSGLWSHLRAAKLVTQNPWQNVQTRKPDTIAPKAPSEDDIKHFFEWLDAKNWELLSVFFRVKAFLCCRTDDLCQVLSNAYDAKNKNLTIIPSDDKTHTERVVRLPDDLAARLNAIKGQTYLWERYTEDAKTHRPGRRNAKEFTPSVMYWFVDDICPQYRKAHPDRFPITAHDLRRRGITLTTAEHGIDNAAAAIGIHPDTARRYYLDAQKAFKTEQVYKSMASALVPPQTPVTKPEPEVTKPTAPETPQNAPQDANEPELIEVTPPPQKTPQKRSTKK